MKREFTKIYEKNLWGSEESVSGKGSELAVTNIIRSELPILLSKYNVKVLLDAPCGDFNWMKEVQFDGEYIGVDIVDEIIKINNKKYGNIRRKFLVADVTSDPLPKADLILCRDCFMHFSINDISKALKNFKITGAKWFLSSSYINGHNINVESGTWFPINLMERPFSFPPPLEKIPDTEQRYLGLWKLEDVLDNIRIFNQHTIRRVPAFKDYFQW